MGIKRQNTITEWKWTTVWDGEIKHVPPTSSPFLDRLFTSTFDITRRKKQITRHARQDNAKWTTAAANEQRQPELNVATCLRLTGKNGSSPLPKLMRVWKKSALSKSLSNILSIQPHPPTDGFGCADGWHTQSSYSTPIRNLARQKHLHLHLPRLKMASCRISVPLRTELEKSLLTGWMVQYKC